jgi:hypothetical protein
VVQFESGTILKDKYAATLPTSLYNGSVASFTVNGQLTYNGDATRPICTKNSSVSSVYLKRSSDSAIVYTTTADTVGNYVFTNVAVGNYFLDATTTINAKYGYDVTDAFVINVIGGSLSGMQATASDVNEDSFIDDTDAFIVYLSANAGNNKVTSWVAPDWLFDNVPVIISNSNVTQDFSGISSGDANGEDFIPIP